MASPTTIFFAYVAAAYIGACLLYLLGSPLAGRPWAEYLQKLPRETLRIRSKSGQRRAALFAASVVLSIVVLAAWRPFGGLKEERSADAASE